MGTCRRRFSSRAFSPYIRESRFRNKEIFAFGIQNPGLWNPESHQRLESGIQVPLTKDPESMAWNPESKTALVDCLIWGEFSLKSSGFQRSPFA